MTKLKMSEKENVVELDGQGNKNEIGEGLTGFCQGNTLANMVFKPPKYHTYTSKWKQTTFLEVQRDRSTLL